MVNNRAQMKIQQMAFMLIAVTLFFVLVAMFFLMIFLSDLRRSAELLEEKNALLLVSKLSESPEFSCGASFGTQKTNCIDGDKMIALKENINKYTNPNFWGISGIRIIRFYPADIRVGECSSGTYPNCTHLTLLFDQTILNSRHSATGNVVLTGMSTMSPPCPEGEQGEWANNYRQLVGGYGYYTGYRWKEVNGICYKACGPANDMDVCPTAPFGGGSSVDTLGCFNGDWAKGRCVTNFAYTSGAYSWTDAFSSESPTSDACVQSADGTWFIPHGGEDYMMWTASNDPSLACQCGQNYKYDVNCHPASCQINDCCEFCFNGVQDCGETGVDEGSVCDVCVCEDVPPTTEDPEIEICFEGRTIYVRESKLENYEPYVRGKCSEEYVPIEPPRILFGTGVSNFVAFCRKEKINEIIQTKCEMAKIIVYYGK